MRNFLSFRIFWNRPRTLRKNACSRIDGSNGQLVEVPRPGARKARNLLLKPTKHEVTRTLPARLGRRRVGHALPGIAADPAGVSIELNKKNGKANRQPLEERRIPAFPAHRESTHALCVRRPPAATSRRGFQQRAQRPRLRQRRQSATPGRTFPGAERGPHHASLIGLPGSHSTDSPAPGISASLFVVARPPTCRDNAGVPSRQALPFVLPIE